MKKTLTILLALGLLLCAGCKKEEAEEVVELTGSAAAAQATGENAQPAAQGEYGNSPAVEAGAVCAYVFEGAEGVTLYGAVEFKNTGDCPVILESADFTFDVGGQTLSRQFTPVLNAYDVILPGQSSYAAAWWPESSLTAGTAAALTAVKLSPVKSDAARRPLGVSWLYLADNYPGFTTMTGALYNGGTESCAMNLTYVGFYDQSDVLLGAIYFTKNAELEPGDEKTFVVHMKELPVTGLAEKCAYWKTTSFGF